MLRIKEILDEKGMSQQELAEKTGLTAATISSIINGKSSPKLVILEKIAEAFGISIQDLFPQTNDKIQLIIKNKLHTFYSMAELKEFVEEGE